MHLNTTQVSQYLQDGYLLVPGLFTPEEIELLLKAFERGGRVDAKATATLDGSGKAVNLAAWDEIGDDIWSAVTTNPRIINPVRILLGEEAGFYHGKVMLKEARTGGAWEWHQDYGYWYNNGFVFPRMMSVFVALDRATRENGCLQVLRGSHQLGRLEHQAIGKQTGVNPQRMPQIAPLFEQVHCEMEPGTVLFFHCNLLHASQANTSDRARRSFILCYNALSNPRIKTGVGVFAAPTVPCPTGPDDNILRFRAAN